MRRPRIQVLSPIPDATKFRLPGEAPPYQALWSPFLERIKDRIPGSHMMRTRRQHTPFLGRADLAVNSSSALRTPLDIVQVGEMS
jgi:hypothetical protein